MSSRLTIVRYLQVVGDATLRVFFPTRAIKSSIVRSFKQHRKAICGDDGFLDADLGHASMQQQASEQHEHQLQLARLGGSVDTATSSSSPSSASSSRSGSPLLSPGSSSSWLPVSPRSDKDKEKPALRLANSVDRAARNRSPSDAAARKSRSPSVPTVVLAGPKLGQGPVQIGGSTVRGNADGSHRSNIQQIVTLSEKKSVGAGSKVGSKSALKAKVDLLTQLLDDEIQSSQKLREMFLEAVRDRSALESEIKPTAASSLLQSARTVPTLNPAMIPMANQTPVVVTQPKPSHRSI